jgi:hypothetical protein
MSGRSELNGEFFRASELDTLVRETSVDTEGEE